MKIGDENYIVSRNVIWKCRNYAFGPNKWYSDLIGSWSIWIKVTYL